MSPTIVNFMLVAALSVALIMLLIIWLRRRRLLKRLDSLNDELVSVSDDSSVGRRLQAVGNGDIGDLTTTINRLFDAIGDRDEEIQDKDKLFAEFSRTLPEIVLVHDERILLANDSAANLLGLEPDQLEGRDVADLVKPAYRALFRKTMANRLAGGVCTTPSGNPVN